MKGASTFNRLTSSPKCGRRLELVESLYGSKHYDSLKFWKLQFRTWTYQSKSMDELASGMLRTTETPRAQHTNQRIRRLSWKNTKCSVDVSFFFSVDRLSLDASLEREFLCPKPTSFNMTEIDHQLLFSYLKLPCKKFMFQWYTYFFIFYLRGGKLAMPAECQ